MSPVYVYIDVWYDMVSYNIYLSVWPDIFAPMMGERVELWISFFLCFNLRLWIYGIRELRKRGSGVCLYYSFNKQTNKQTSINVHARTENQVSMAWLHFFCLERQRPSERLPIKLSMSIKEGKGSNQPQANSTAPCACFETREGETERAIEMSFVLHFQVRFLNPSDRPIDRSLVSGRPI